MSRTLIVLPRSYARFAPDYVVGATAVLEGRGAAPISARERIPFSPPYNPSILRA
jgi:hypothetical protein